jgi:hypothetical protein
MSRGVPVPARLGLLAGVGVAMLGGLYAALLLIGVPLPAVRPHLESVHGPVMVLGVVGTLVALERAVALGARWALSAPGCTAAGALVLVVTGPTLVGQVLLAGAGAALLMVYVALWRRQPSVALLAQAGGAFAWYAAALLWLGGFEVAEVVPWLAGFVVLTIAGERLELARVGIGRSAERWFLGALAAVVVGLAASMLWPGAGHQVWGLALLVLAGWLVTSDVARRTVRSSGLVRYAAVGLLAGYGWLAVAAMLWAGGGTAVSGARYDAVLHAVFLGFTFSMIFVHAPIILPAVLRRPLPYHPVLYVPLFLLHGSLVVRLGVGDLLEEAAVWRWSGVANVAAVVIFAVAAATLATRAAQTVDRGRPQQVAVPVPAEPRPLGQDFDDRGAAATTRAEPR